MPINKKMYVALLKEYGKKKGMRIYYALESKRRKR